MTPSVEALQKFFEFSGALAVVTGAMAWWRNDSDENDDMEIAAANTVLDSISDADTVTKIDCLTDRNLRDQLTVEQAEETHEEREMRRWGWGRN